MQLMTNSNAPVPPVARAFNPMLLPDASQRGEFEALLLGYLVLNSLSEDQRWITVVTDKSLDRQNYRTLFGQKARLRFVQAKAEDILWISWQCLAQGNSQAVVTVVESVDSEDRQHLLSAAQLGQSTLHLIQTG